MSEQEPHRQVNFRVDVPDEKEAGSYANFLGVWHTPHEFTLDFAVMGQPAPEDADDERSPIVVPCPVVARIKIPPTVMFDVLRALNENMTRFEDTHGVIRRPGEKAAAEDDPT